MMQVCTGVLGWAMPEPYKEEDSYLWSQNSFVFLSPGLNTGKGQSGGDFLSFCFYNCKLNAEAIVSITLHMHQSQWVAFYLWK